ncbi:MAG: peptide chain release factor 1 [Desulfobacteraceae bacterium]|nr:MAG: peptide chain release factor 1 [Desulfobacteraceae bacterium]
MLSQIEDVERRLSSLEYELSRQEVIQQQSLYQKYLKEHVSLQPIVDAFRKYKALKEKIKDTKSLLNDPDREMRELARKEIDNLKDNLAKLEREMGLLLLPKDPKDEKNCILEIRAGTGGEEAALFVADLFRMYGYYIENKGWKMDILSQSPTGLGGFKELIALIEGQRVYSGLKYESGVHRVQRIPETESKGRIHTSAVTIAVLPEAEEVDVSIDPADLRIDVYRSSGPGGQSVNTTDSAVRITHIPTGSVVSCQDEKSQHKNKAKAMKVLRSRLLDIQQAEQRSKISEERKHMVGSGDRSERIRTYNFPQGRVTDHRIGLTVYRLEEVLHGELDLILHPLLAHFKAESEKGQAEQLL